MTDHITLEDLLAQETKRNPYAFYAHLREQAPLTYITGFPGVAGGWITTSYEDAIAILKDPRFTKDVQKLFRLEDRPATSTSEENTAIKQIIAWRRDMLTVDPPDHTRLRGLVSKAFTPRMIEQLRPRIQQITDELLDTVQERGAMDLIADFAFPLPITVISEMLGIPTADRQQFRNWTQALITSGEGSQQREGAATAMESFAHYIKTLLVEKRAHPGSDLVSDLIQAEESGDTLNENELISTIFLLIVAGHETTVNLIGTGTLALLQHPAQLRLLQQDATLIPSAVEELLRYTAPVSLSSPRWALEDIPMHGQVIRQGEMVLLSLIAANTDPQQFNEPDELEITRQVNRHLAFGKGIHVCLGAPLARLEGQIAFATLLRRLPALHLAEEPEQLAWNRTPILRGLTSLPVAF
ncbi:cytochrome P450 family protein [Dictyobacter kobayashii]|uniref:Polyketide biosynthesis cytochrome P450 PksS n=1 Tax=Dictyobacter kobayashii TaxID=2014872 RepID=A0A402ARQ1_9CHLR|nr:cytochrome P450 [Dictyobacter kobayashii]GCE21767.1 polyketide biosynthesis cytochrome P450 PksS [Dictyobacter kobayashii]